MKHALSALALILCLSACASPEEQAARMAAANKPVYCTGKQDCEIKWGRALRWVRSNSQYALEQASDMMIKTAGPLPNEPAAAYTVTKSAVGKGRYDIDFDARSGNLFGCVPNCLDQKANFANAVMHGTAD